MILQYVFLLMSDHFQKMSLSCADMRLSTFQSLFYTLFYGVIFVINLLFLCSDNARINITYQAEEKRGQFLGSTLKSTGNTFLVI